MSSSPGSPELGATDEGYLRVSLQTISVRRVDRAEEDDFKTWCSVYVIHDELPDAKFWHTVGDDAKLGRTSVRC